MRPPQGNFYRGGGFCGKNISPPGGEGARVIFLKRGKIISSPQRIKREGAGGFKKHGEVVSQTAAS